MTLIEILLLAIGLAMDAFAVSLAAGASGYITGKRPVFRLAFHFGLFQFLMPILGWSIGISIVHYVSIIDHWVAFGLLLFVGVRMIQSGFKNNSQRTDRDPSRGKTLVMLSVATSIDAFAIGVTLAMIGVSILYPSLVIGFVTGSLCVVATWFGKRLHLIWGKRMEVAGGGILILLGFRILISHLASVP